MERSLWIHLNVFVGLDVSDGWMVVILIELRWITILCDVFIFLKSIYSSLMYDLSCMIMWPKIAKDVYNLCRHFPRCLYFRLWLTLIFLNLPSHEVNIRTMFCNATINFTIEMFNLFLTNKNQYYTLSLFNVYLP